MTFDERNVLMSCLESKLKDLDYGKVTIEVQAGKVFRIVKEESIKL